MPSEIKAICYPEADRFIIAATVWGCTHEQGDKIDKNCLQVSRSHTVDDSGLIINPFYPQCLMEKLAVSVVALVFRNKILLLKRNNGFSDPPTCLESDSSGQLSINKLHSYNYQVQWQMNVGGIGYCEFNIAWREIDLHVEWID